MIGRVGVQTWWRQMIAAGSVGGLIVAFFVLLPDDAHAHGTMQSPPSRTYTCRFLDNPEAPTSEACRAAVAAGGIQPVYDWNEVNLPNAAGRHREIIPDGRLCSAGRDKHRGFDLARLDWPATRMPAGGSYTFRMLGTAPHKGTIDLYLTHNGYDPRGPLHWSDLDPAPFLSISTSHESGGYEAAAQLPGGRLGRHVIYAIWQRTDSPEAFYSCSDVLIGGAGTKIARSEPIPTPASSGPVYEASTPIMPIEPMVAPAHEPDPTNEPTSTAVGTTWPGPADTSSVDTSSADTSSADRSSAETSSADTSADPSGATASWRPYVAYATGVQVSYNGQVWESVQGHFSLPGWEPALVPALWRIAFDPNRSDQAWQPNAAYPLGARVIFAGAPYVCIQAHTSLAGWEPPTAPALWKPE